MTGRRGGDGGRGVVVWAWVGSCDWLFYGLLFLVLIGLSPFGCLRC